MIALGGIGVIVLIVCVCLLCYGAVLAPLPAVPIVEMAEPYSGPIVLYNDFGALSWESTVTAELLSVGGADVTEGLHAVLRHGEADVLTVRERMRARAREDARWWSQPPCQDGRKRYVIPIDAGHWAVWVLQPVSANVLQEVTAFVTENPDYVRIVHDQCGNGWGDGMAY